MAESKRPKSTAREYAEAVFWSLVLFLMFRASVAEAFRIPTESMVRTLLVGDFLFASKFDYGPRLPFTHVRLPGLRRPHPGDIIVFRWPGDRSQNWIKRCVAVGGQTVEVRHKRVYVDGRPLEEAYVQHVDAGELPASVSPRDNMAPVTVPPEHFFMMGDNRDNSNDSRFWGPIAMDDVQGRAMFVYYSTGGNAWWNVLLDTRFDRLFRPIR